MSTLSTILKRYKLEGPDICTDKDNEPVLVTWAEYILADELEKLKARHYALLAQVEALENKVNQMNEALENVYFGGNRQ